MLHITYCYKEDSEVTYEASCEKCTYFTHFVQLSIDWFECTYLEERLQIGL